MNKMLRRLHHAVILFGVVGLVSTARAVPPSINTISPDSVIEKLVPQPSVTIAGSTFVVGLPSPTNRPTITITHTTLQKVSFNAIANVNFSGTSATIPANLNHFNMLQMPLGTYDVKLQRPDGEFTIVPGGFSINPEPEPIPGAIEMRIASHWGGPILGMDTSEDGTLAYIANGRMLRILDLTDESNPTELGSIYLTGVNDVKVKGDYAFVAANSPHRFSVVDVSDPAAPELVWVQSSGSSQSSVLLYGDYAYVGSSAFDISDPRNVVAAGSVAGAGGVYAIANDRLYVGHDSNSVHLKIYDLAANPANPPLIGTLTAPAGTEGSARSIAVAGGHVYIGQNNADPDSPTPWALLTIDASNPAAPFLTNIKYDFRRELAVAANNDRLFVAATRGVGIAPSLNMGLAVYDIATDPSQPALLATYKSHPLSEPYRVQVDGDRAYVVDHGEGLLLLDISDPEDPIRLGNYHSPSTLKRMAKSGEHLFVIDALGGVTILDVSDSSAPQVIGNYLLESVDDIAASARDLALVGDHLFITAYRMGLFALDVSDPTNPTLVGRIPPPLPNWENQSHLAALAVSGNVAHVGFWDWISPTFVQIRHLTVNVSDPANMVEIARSEHIPGDVASDIVLHDNFQTAYTAKGSNTVHKIDVAEISNPHDTGVILGVADTDLAREGNLLLVATRSDNLADPGVHLYDVTVSSSPVQVGYINSGAAEAVDLQNSRAYTVGLGNYDHLNILDVSDPADPQYMYTLPNIGGANTSSVFVSEPHVFVTAMGQGNLVANAGLSIVDVYGVEPVIPADLTGDGVVNVFDLFELLSNWNTAGLGASLAAPMDLVDGSDLIALISNWSS